MTTDNDWFPRPDEDAPNPMRSAQAGMRPALPKRFYEQATVARQEDGSYALLLDGKPARTPASQPLALPSQELGEALAAEWMGQGPEIDPRAMPLTRLANSAIDGVTTRVEEVRADVVRYAAADLVCYRADRPERLVAAQSAAWDPVLAWAREATGAQFILSEGVVHVTQPEAAIAAVRARVAKIVSPFQLAALHTMTTLTGSVLIALAHAGGALDADEAWAAAHVDEIFQESLWGEDEEAMARRAARRTEFRAASRVFALS
jgi:chaperone required for assembly of F1-ATPase